MVPLRGRAPIAELDIWHGSNWAEPDYIDYIPAEYFQFWTDAEREWAARLYQTPEFEAVRTRYIEISRALNTTPRGPERTRLVEEMSELKR